MIHQISQPLTAITGNVEAAGDRLQAGCMPLDQLSELVDEIRHDALRAGEVIRHARGLLLGPSSAEDVVDANALTMETIQLVRAESDRRGVRIETDLRSVPTLRGNRLELQQVLLNLILNGIEAMAHTPRGQRRLRIRTGRPALNRIRLVIVDHGCGVPPDRLPRLFEPFYTTKERGLGLGLAIARKIVAAHGGRIRVANNTSRPGATFAVDLPSNRDDTSREAARRLK